MRLPSLVVLVLAALPVQAGEADVVDVRVTARGGQRFDFAVTVKSRDTGWSYYADAFEVLAPDGTLLGRRVLAHPHDNEQPFSRELHGVAIPPNIDRVTVRARHNPRGYDGATMEVGLPR